MNPLRIFAKFNGKTSAVYGAPVPGSSGSYEQLAIYVRGMPVTAYLAARLVWSQDINASSQLEKWVLWALSKEAARDGWREGCEDKLQKLARLAVLEHYNPKPFNSVKARYQFAGLTRGQWNTWGRRYEIAYGIIAGYLNNAYSYSIHNYDAQ